MDENDKKTYFQSLASSQASADFNKWAEDSSPELADIEHDLRGDATVVEDNKLIWKKVGEPLLNEAGIRYVMSEFKAFANKNTFLSNISEEDVFRICKFTSFAFINALFYNYKKFALRPEHYEALVEKFNNFIEFAARRPVDEGERKAVTQTVNETRVVTDVQPSQGIGGIFKGKGR